MRIDTLHKHGITRYELRDGGRHLLTFDSLADLQSFCDLVVEAVELAEHAHDVEAARIAAGGVVVGAGGDLPQDDDGGDEFDAVLDAIGG